MPRSSRLSGADRYNFMLALTGYLINNRQQKISDVAKHFEVTEEEIKSAAVTISLSGVGGYRPDELFFLDYDLLEEGIVDLSFAPTLDSVPRLSTRQAAAMVSGLQFLLQLVGESDRAEISNLLEILSRGASKSSQLPFVVQNLAADEELVAVRQAVAESRLIRCYYRNSDGDISKREIEPVLLESRDNNWFLRGFCRSNQQIRVFRLDRMREIELLDEVTERRFDLNSGDEIYLVNNSDTEVLFEVDPEAFSLIADYKPDFEISGNKTVQVKIAIGHLDNLGRIVARFSGRVRVLAPDKAREAVLAFAKSALKENPSPLKAE